MDRKITSEDFHPMKQRTEKTLTGLELKLKNLKKSTSPFKTFVNKEVPMLENIAMYYKKADGKTKKKILGCIFSKKLVLKKEKVATYEFTKPIEVLLKWFGIRDTTSMRIWINPWKKTCSRAVAPNNADEN